MNKHDKLDDFLYDVMPKLEQKILNNVPHEEDLDIALSDQLHNRLRRLIKRRNSAYSWWKCIGWGRRVAVATLLLLFISLNMALGIAEYRAKLFETVTQVYNKFSTTSISKIDASGVAPIEIHLPEYIPEGFSLSHEEQSDYTYQATFSNTNSQQIWFIQQAFYNMSTTYDTEGISPQTLFINNQKIEYFTNKGINQVYWFDETEYYYILISDVDLEELFSMAKSILEK